MQLDRRGRQGRGTSRLHRSICTLDELAGGRLERNQGAAKGSWTGAIHAEARLQGKARKRSAICLPPDPKCSGWQRYVAHFRGTTKIYVTVN
jgi:hypothetical protein